ncbi:MAG: redoxin domain-containing protein [Planctomycetes bacterium]|nr:redoxin domain-containing protein [Planctomycetota bacterium]
MRIAAFLLLALLPAALPACMHPGSKSNVIDEECPELQLEEEMVQGDPITDESLEGKVVLFIFYQRDCDGCERIAMPRIQKLYEEYKAHPCAKVFVINTAFDKDIYPNLADVEETRKHLLRMDWTMPVARDLDEQTNALFTVDDESGTPQAVVVNEKGVVCAHDWYTEDKEMDAVDARFRTLAAGMNCHCERMPREVCDSCTRSRDYIKEGDYERAWDEANTICQSYGYTDKEKADAAYLQKWIEDTASEHFENLEREFEVDPETAITRAEETVSRYKGVTGAKDFAAKVENWRKSDALQNFRKDRADLEKATADLGRAGVTETGRKAVVDRLRSIADRAATNRVGQAARKQLEKVGAIEKADKGSEVKATGKGGSSLGRRSSSASGDSAIKSKSRPATGNAGPAATRETKPATSNLNRKVRQAR